MNVLKQIEIWMVLAILGCGLSIMGCDEKTKKADAPKASPPPVGMVDMDRVATEIGVNAKYQEQLTAYRDRLKKNLEEALVPMQKDLEKLQDELRKKVDAIPEAERKSPNFKAPLELEDSYRRVVAKQQQIQAETQTREAKLQEYDRKMKQDFQSAIQPALSAIAEAKEIQMIVPRGASLYVVPDIDLTNVVIAHLKAHPIVLPTAPVE